MNQKLILLGFFFVLFPFFVQGQIFLEAIGLKKQQILKELKDLGLDTKENCEETKDGENNLLICSISTQDFNADIIFLFYREGNICNGTAVFPVDQSSYVAIVRIMDEFATIKDGDNRVGQSERTGEIISIQENFDESEGSVTFYCMDEMLFNELYLQPFMEE